MIVKMKLIESRAVEYAKKFAKSWEFFLISSDSYMDGYRQALKDNTIQEVGSNEVVMEFKEGEHQLTPATFEKWKNEQNQKG